MLYNLKIRHFGDDVKQINYYSYLVQRGVDKRIKSLEVLEQNENFSFDSFFSEQFVQDGDVFSKVLAPIPQMGLEVGDLVQWFYDDTFKKVPSKQSDYNLYGNLRRTKQTIYDIARSNSWEYFATFTFSSRKIDRMNYRLCLDRLRVWLQNFRSRKAPDLKYLFVCELHKKGGIHMHALLSGVPDQQIKLAFYGRYFLPAYNVLGISDISRIRDHERVTSYITKYITKELLQIPDLSRFRYFCSKGLQRPQDDFVLMESEEKTVRLGWHEVPAAADLGEVVDKILVDYNIDYSKEAYCFDKPITYFQVTKREAPE